MMAYNPVSFYGSGSGVATAASPIQRDYMIDPRRQLAMQLIQQGSSTAPVQSPLEGLTRALTAGVGGYFGGQARREMQGREQRLGKDMASILSGAQQAPMPMPEGVQGPPQMSPGGYEGMMQAGAGMENPDVQPFLQNLQMGDIQNKQALELAREQARIKAQMGTTAPMQNYAARNQLVQQFGEGSPEVRRFDNYVRQTAPINLGGQVVIPDVARPGEVAGAYEVTPKPEQMPEFKGAQAEAAAVGSAVGKERGTVESQLEAAEASLPRLEGAVEQLKSLGEKATYTMAGQAADFARRQAGMEPSEGSVARAEYIAHVKNNVLPLLRQTFGAAFTAAEGESLLATLGDPDMAPAEKSAVLDAFIADKKADLQTLRRQTGTPSGAQQAPSQDEVQAELRRRGLIQ